MDRDYAEDHQQAASNPDVIRSSSRGTATDDSRSGPQITVLPNTPTIAHDVVDEPLDLSFEFPRPPADTLLRSRSRYASPTHQQGHLSEPVILPSMRGDEEQPDPTHAEQSVAAPGPRRRGRATSLRMQDAHARPHSAPVDAGRRMNTNQDTADDSNIVLQRPAQVLSMGYGQRTRARTIDNSAGHISRHSILDHTVPVVHENGSATRLSEKSGPKNVEERLRPTLESAEMELTKYRLQAKWTGWALNITIGTQVVLGALTTGVAAAGSGKHIPIVTSILGGLSTLAASYLAKTRGTGEPEASELMVHELESFVRDCKACMLDHGYYVGDQHDGLVKWYRDRLERILGNSPQSVNERSEERVQDV